MVTRDHILQWLRMAGKILEANRDFLTELDAAIGDADHGINLDRGFKKVLDTLPSLENKDIGSILLETGMALVSSVGGASGPLYGTLFMKAGTASTGKQELHTADLAMILKAGLAALMDRGKAKAGDKTMVDALAPGVEALENAALEGKNADEALRMAAESAKHGMKNTISMAARKGRASYLGDRSIGHQDPGATSSYLILKAFHAAVS